LQAPHIFTKGLDIATQLSGDYINAPPKDGFYPEFGNMVTGEGFISAGPGYRRHFFGDRAFVDGSAAVSVRSYKQAQVRFEAPSLAKDRFTVGSQVKWLDYTQVDFFGIGSNTLQRTHSEYRLKDTDWVGYGAYRPWTWFSVGGNFGWLTRPSILGPEGPLDR